MLNKVETDLTSPLRFDRSHDVQLRTDHSVAKFKGEYYYCSWIPSMAGEGLDIVLTKLSDFREKNTISSATIHAFANKNYLPTSIIVHSSSVDLDFSTPPLGYINLEHYKTGVRYMHRVERTFSRKYTHGVSSANLAIRNFDVPASINRGSVFFTSGFTEMINRQYPDLDNILFNLKETGVSQLALNNNWYLKVDEFNIKKLFWLEQPVGFFTPASKYVLNILKTFQTPYITNLIKREISTELELAG